MENFQRFREEIQNETISDCNAYINSIRPVLSIIDSRVSSLAHNAIEADDAKLAQSIIIEAKLAKKRFLEYGLVSTYFLELLDINSYAATNLSRVAELFSGKKS